LSADDDSASSSRLQELNMRDFLISVASGFAVAVLSAIFLRRPLPRSGPSQNMRMDASRKGGVTRLALIFLFGLAVASAVFLIMNGNRPG
jgi:hypothetical protein